MESNLWFSLCSLFISCVSYVPYPEDLEILKTVHTIYRKMNRHAEALSISIRLNNKDMILDDFASCTDP